MVEELERENRAYKTERQDLISQIDSLVAAVIKQRRQPVEASPSTAEVKTGNIHLNRNMAA